MLVRWCNINPAGFHRLIVPAKGSRQVRTATQHLRKQTWSIRRTVDYDADGSGQVAWQLPKHPANGFDRARRTADYDKIAICHKSPYKGIEEANGYATARSRPSAQNAMGSARNARRFTCEA